MALTLKQQPVLHQPAHNPLNYVIESDMAATLNFRYFTEVYVDLVKVAEFFDIPRPTTNLLWKDVHSVVEPFVRSGIGNLSAPAAVGFDAQRKQYNIQVTEYVGSVSGAVFVSSNRVGNNMALSWTDYIANDFTNYYSTNISGKFRTQRNNIKIKRNEVYRLSWITELLNTLESAVNRINIIPFTESGDLSAINYVDGDQGDTSIINAYKTILVGFDLCSMPSNAIGFRVVAQGQANNPITQVVTFLLNTECAPYQSTRLYYLNKLGGWDAYTFNANPIFTTDIENEMYNRILGSVTSTGYVYDSTQHRELPLYTKYTERIQLRTQWLNDEESLAMQELIASPIVLASFDGAAVVPVNIISNSYQRRYIRANKAFDATMEIKLSYDNQTQRR